MKKIGGDIYTGEFGGDGEAVVNFFLILLICIYIYNFFSCYEHILALE